VQFHAALAVVKQSNGQTSDKQQRATVGNDPVIANLAPGFTRSEMVNPDTPEKQARYDALAARHSAMNRLGNAEETANTITWLCSEAASFVNGAALTVDGGHMVRQY